MRRSILSLAVIAMSMLLFAQTPNSFNYQAVVRQADGTILQNSNVSFRFTVLEGSTTGSSLYAETQSATTNQYGLVTLTIGDGTLVSGDFTTIEWGADNHFLKVDMDINGGTSFTDMSTQQLVAVPYAMHASTVTHSDNDSTNEYQDLSKSGATITLSDGGGSVNLDDDDASNELQDISKSGATISLSDGGGSVDLNDDDASNELQTLSKAGIDLTLSDGGGTFSVADNDNNSSNELQTVSVTGTNLTLSDGGGTVSIADNDNDASNEFQDLTSAGDSFSLTNSSVHVNLSDLGHWVKDGSDLHYTSGNVGVNLSTPAYPLDVNGNAAFSGRIIHKGDANTDIEFNTDLISLRAGGEVLIEASASGSSDFVKLGDGGDVNINLNNHLWVDGNTGTVGIGEYNNNPNPAYALDIESPSEILGGLNNINGNVDYSSGGNAIGIVNLTSRVSENYGGIVGINNTTRGTQSVSGNYRTTGIYNYVYSAPDDVSGQSTYGEYNYVVRADSGSGATWGNYLDFNHSGNDGAVYGLDFDIDVTGANSDVAYGQRTSIYKAGAGSLFGDQVDVYRSNANSGYTYGRTTTVSAGPTSTAGYDLWGHYMAVNNSAATTLRSTGQHLDFNKTGSGGGEAKGSYMDIDQTGGTGSLFGLDIDLDRSTSGTTIGLRTIVNRTGSSYNASMYGGIITTDNDGSGTTYGLTINTTRGTAGVNNIGTVYGLTSSSYAYGTGVSTVYGGRFYGYNNQTSTTGTRYSYGSYNYSYGSSVNGSSRLYGLYSSFGGNGDVEYAAYFSGSTYTTGSYLPSDSKLKTDISLGESSLDRIKQLKVYSYNYNTDKYSHMNLPEGMQTGFIAQELGNIFPELTTAAAQPPLEEEEITQMEEDGIPIPESAREEVVFTAVNYAGLVPHLTKAIQEQQEIIDAQASELETQSVEMEAMKLKMAEMEALLKQLAEAQN